MIVVIAWTHFSQPVLTRFLSHVAIVWNTILTTILDLFSKISFNRCFKQLTTTIDYWKVLYTTKTRFTLCQNGQTTCLNTYWQGGWRAYSSEGMDEPLQSIWEVEAVSSEHIWGIGAICSITTIVVGLKVLDGKLTTIRLERLPIGMASGVAMKGISMISKWSFDGCIIASQLVRFSYTNGTRGSKKGCIRVLVDHLSEWLFTAGKGRLVNGRWDDPLPGYIKMLVAGKGRQWAAVGRAGIEVQQGKVCEQGKFDLV
jgi:hypothetical protein